MKKSELKRMIREEIQRINEEAFDPSVHVNQTHPNRGTLYVGKSREPKKFHIQNEIMPGVGAKNKDVYHFEDGKTFKDLESAFNYYNLNS